MKYIKKCVNVLLAVLMLGTALIPIAVSAEENNSINEERARFHYETLWAGGYTEEWLAKYIAEIYEQYSEAKQSEGAIGRIWIMAFPTSPATPEESYDHCEEILTDIIFPVLDEMGVSYTAEHPEETSWIASLYLSPEEIETVHTNLLMASAEYSEYSIYVHGSVYDPSRIGMDDGADLNWLFYGYINDDSKIDALDYIITKRYILGTYTATAEQIARMDVSGDGTVNALDYIYIKKYVLKTVTAFPANDVMDM